MTSSLALTPTPPEYRDPEYALHSDGTRVERLEDIPRRRAAVSPDAVAVITAEGHTTFADLDRESNRVGQALLAAGVAPGDRVGYVGENAPSFLAVMYGASKMGGIPMALNFRLAGPEVAYILSNAEPAAIVLGRGLEHLVPVARNSGIDVVVTLDEADGAVAYQAWIADDTRWSSRHQEPTAYRDLDPGYSRGPDETALLFFTSGTTGHPKGIELTGPNIGKAIAAMHYLLELDATSVAFAPVPFFHVSGLGLALVAGVNGAALLLRNQTSPADLLTILQDYRVSHAVAVPTLIQFMVARPEARTADWSTLKYLIYGSSPIPEPVLREATEVFGCRFLQSYGLTESTGGVTMLSPEDHQPTPETAHRLRSVGRPMPNVPVRVVDPVTIEDLPPGERGEVLIGGGHVMRRYWRNPEATAAAILDNGWLRTGDGGYLDEDGYLYLHDRLKDMIVSGGENVYPAEVESTLTAHPEISQVAVIAVPSERWGESAYAIVVPTPGATVTESDLIAWSRERMAHFKCPAGVTFVDALPLNASGKLLKTVLRTRYARP